MRTVLPFLAGLLLTAVADPAEGTPPWVAPLIFSAAIGAMGWFFSQLTKSVKTNLTLEIEGVRNHAVQEIARVDAAAKVCAEALAIERSEHVKTKELVSDLRVAVSGMASQESVREMERDLGALVRSEVGSLRASIDALASKIHGGNTAK